MDRIARALLEDGLAKGERIALLSRNDIEPVLLYYAASKAGVVPVPLNERLSPAEWVWIANDAGARWLLAEPRLAEALEPRRGELESVERLVVTSGAREGWESLESLEASTSSGGAEREGSPEDDLYQMYTSGTTGRPKGAVIQQRAMMAQLHQLALAYSVRPGERMLVVAPLYHAAAAVAAFAAVQMGGSLFIQRRFDPEETVRVLAEERIAIGRLVPATIRLCLSAVPDAHERSYPHLRLMVYGASPIAEETLRHAIEVFRCDFLQGYGMTEVTAVATYLLPRDHRRGLEERPDLLLSAGRPVLGTEIRVLDQDDRPLPPGTSGELAIRGPQLMRGYWNRPEASAEALRGGWMHTGDVGSIDDEGYVFVRDRLKDTIVSGGENVHPREVEDVLLQHPEVAEVAVFGVPDERWGETVKAVVVPRAGTRPSEESILEFCVGRLGGFKRPRSVDFAAALPRNPSGKILKRELREPYWAGRSRRVG